MCQATGTNIATAISESPRLIVAAHHAEPAIDDRIQKNPERQLVRGQSVKNAGNKAYLIIIACPLVLRWATG
jgi:hypothetical protein